MTLNNFVSTQQRAVQSIHEQCNNLRQQKRLFQLEQARLKQENATLKQIGKDIPLRAALFTDNISPVQQIPGAAESLAHPHRFSLPGDYVFGNQPPMFAS